MRLCARVALAFIFYFIATVVRLNPGDENSEGKGARR
jgi:hypothetical protein